MFRFFLICAVLISESSYAQSNKNDSTSYFVSQLMKSIAGKEKEPAEKVFKNIKSLNGVPAGRMLKIMELGFSKSLGVGCDHCHNTSAWENDDIKEKQTARKMWTMVANIRKELGTIVNEKAMVNCTTCHRGEVVPATNMK